MKAFSFATTEVVKGIAQYWSGTSTNLFMYIVMCAILINK